MIRRLKVGEIGEKPCDPQEAIVIFGGFSEYEPAMSASTMIILEPQQARIREIQIPMARIKSYMGHATAVRPDRRGFILFGGAPIPEELPPGQPQPFLDSTTALDFWETPASFPSEAEEEAQRQAGANPVKTKTLSSGDVYVGEMNADRTQRHGKGKCMYANGDEYEGDWRGDQRSGQGVMRYNSNQGVYAGEWEEDCRHGFGIYEYPVPESSNGGNAVRQSMKYEGQWICDRKHGQGTLTFSDGTKLVGLWVDDVLDTRERSCLEGYDDGQNGVCRYVGEVCDGVPHGQGESHHAASGEVYEGGWITGRRSGHGLATLRDGSVYRGEWRNGRRNGHGVFDDVRTRARYDGKWVGGVRCGRGVCKYANKCMYEGDWVNDVRHGTGRYTFTDGSCYEGAWLNDQFCGDGSFMLNIEDNDFTARQKE
ncbi:Radial spoke head 10 B [Phytophthora citrophthora]|uniref:Radial spoke head 10 B n=1 Tax=Phytophthora citrophthora TaxID=4793 RepID=A0AAD9GV50_9STRA|nr:Radial spoke head 10 B [Phytophthora citrophthora]